MRFVWVILLISGTAAAAEDPRLSLAREQIEDLEYEASLATLDDFLTDAAIAREERVEALALRARIMVGFGCNARSIGAFHDLLSVAPDYKLPAGESPKVTQCFARAAPTPLEGSDPPTETTPTETTPTETTPTETTPAQTARTPPPNEQPKTVIAATDPNLQVTEPVPEDSVLTSWWLWTAVGVVVASGAAAGIAVWQTQTPRPSKGNLGEAVFKSW